MGLTRRLSQCEGKVPFETYMLAEKVARRPARKERRRQRAYRCPLCGKYHIGRVLKWG